MSIFWHFLQTMQHSAAERTSLRTPVRPLFATRLAGTDYTPHIDPALLRAIIAASDGARAGAQPLKMPRANMLQIAQYCAAMMGVARQASLPSCDAGSATLWRRARGPA